MSRLLTDLAIILLLFLGISRFKNPHGARQGNSMAAVAMLLAVLMVVYRQGVLDPALVTAGVLIGACIGCLAAMRVGMIQIPAMVAFQHGAGGVAAFTVSYIELQRHSLELMTVSIVSGVLGFVLGAATFSASMIASAKLANRLSSKPFTLPRHGLVLAGVSLTIVALGLFGPVLNPQGWTFEYLVLLALAMLLGILFSIRIGGADMPVLISFLNAAAGIAAALCGVVIGNRLLIACGAVVGASGSVLTHLMCRAMNRRLSKVFSGLDLSTGELRTAAAAKDAPKPQGEEASAEQAAEVLGSAEKIIIIPGYGMALAQAQFKVVELAKLLEARGKQVKYAIHPVAGRMPGHMNVLLAEAEVDYEKLFEMEAINPEFSGCDVAFVIGACDVVNPAAMEAENTPISGMPILLAHQAKHILVCNLDERPGYSGVNNPLYALNNAILLWGDANTSLCGIMDSLHERRPGGS